jgi:hypothetical protein
VGFEPLKLQALPEVEDDCYAAVTVFQNLVGPETVSFAAPNAVVQTTSNLMLLGLWF